MTAEDQPDLFNIKVKAPTLGGTYPHGAGWKEDTTSKAAALKAEETMSPLMQKCLDVMTMPMTNREVWEALGIDKDNVRPAITRLKKLGYLVATDEIREGQRVLRLSYKGVTK